MAAAVYTGLATRRGRCWPTPQNRDAKALHLKLDELIRALEGARNKLVNLEEMTDAELAELHDQFKRLQARVATEDPESTERAA